MRVLVIGGGGREHALGWKLAQGAAVSQVASLPGNPGLAQLGPTITDVSATDVAAVADRAAADEFDLVVVGPEAPLADGLIDELRHRGVAAFGPTKAAARLESSKAFAHGMMARAGVPAAGHRAFDSPDAAMRHLEESPGPYVVKADGLAAGKGVLVTDALADAKAWVRRCFAGGFGTAGSTVVIEEHLDGSELSVFALCGPGGVVGFGEARDHKRLLDKDHGPNTGGMGAYTPVDDHDLEPGESLRMMRSVWEQMAAEGAPFTGFLFAGLMLTEAGPKVLEFNVRLGDPEAQVILSVLADDLAETLHAVMQGSTPSPSWHDATAVNVVVAAEGYPDAPVRGRPIHGLDEAGAIDGVTVFHAGTDTDGERVVSSGGRVLSVVGTGSGLEEAAARAYRAADLIDLEGKHYRRDIAGGAT